MVESVVRVGTDGVSAISERTGRSQAEVMGAVRMIGGAMIGIAVLVVVLNEFWNTEGMFETDSDGNYEGPFGSILGSLESTGAAALGLLVIGLLVLAANRVMGFFGSGGF